MNRAAHVGIFFRPVLFTSQSREPNTGFCQAGQIKLSKFSQNKNAVQMNTACSVELNSF